jgi:co-chaperonin GroES (HSP10)
MRLEALGNYVILKVKELSAKKGSICLPDSAVEGYEDFATVVSIGPMCERELMVGDEVLCPEVGEYEWTDEEDSDQRYFLVEENTIPAKVRR